jgi:hypothetical protein
MSDEPLTDDQFISGWRKCGVCNRRQNTRADGAYCIRCGEILDDTTVWLPGKAMPHLKEIKEKYWIDDNIAKVRRMVWDVIPTYYPARKIALSIEDVERIKNGELLAVVCEDEYEFMIIVGIEGGEA